MKSLLTIFIVGIVSLFLQQVTAQQINTAKLDSLLNLVGRQKMMMGSIAVSRGNKIIYEKSFGYKQMEDDRDAKKLPYDHAKYRIGSITKLFTSVMIFQLVQEHKLSLDTKLSRFYPQIKNANSITISDMMRHRSGIHSFTDDSLYLTYYTKPQQKKFIINVIADYPSDFTPDTKSEYSNSNYFLLGSIIEAIDKRAYAASLKKRIADKLHLSDTYAGGKIRPENNELFSYAYKGDRWIKLPETDMSVPGGAGAIVSTPSDLTVFMNGLFDKKIITSALLTKDTTLKGGFGMDIIKIPFYDRFAWGHDGSIDGFHAGLYKFVPDSLTVAICYNGVNYNSNDILVGILKCCFDMPLSLSEFDVSKDEKVIQFDAAVLRQYAGNYSSKDIGLKMKVFLEGNQLFAQASGQSAFPLSAVSENEFIFKQAGINIVFDKIKGVFLLKQRGATFLFSKE